MSQAELPALRTKESILNTNRVLKNTYILLSVTLLFSAMMASISMFLQISPIIHIISVIASIALGIFVLPRTANSAAGIGIIFLITGLLGFGLGAILTTYLALPKGPELIGTAFAGTGGIFLALSGYALISRSDFSFIGGFLFAGMIAIIIAFIANIFLNIPVLSMVISALIILLMSGFILFDTSRIVRGHETNYIMATYSLYLNIFNIFLSLLNLLGIANEE